MTLDRFLVRYAIPLLPMDELFDKFLKREYNYLPTIAQKLENEIKEKGLGSVKYDIPKEFNVRLTKWEHFFYDKGKFLE